MALHKLSMLPFLMAAHAALTQATAEDCIHSADGESCESQVEQNSLLQTKIRMAEEDNAGCESESPVKSDAVKGLTMGCSSPSCVVAAKKGVSPLVNGCGSGSMNHEDVIGYKHAMVAACNFHDVCYCRCTDPSEYGGKEFGQKQCDDIFYKLMMQICHEKPMWRQAACRSTAYTFYIGLRANGHGAFEVAMNKCCTCSAKPATVDPTWNRWLKEDMKTTSDPSAYDAVRSDILAIMDNKSAFDNYLVPKLKTKSGCDCLTKCGKGYTDYNWCYADWGCDHTWDYCDV